MAPSDNESVSKRVLGGSGPEVIKLEYSLRLKIKHNDWLLVSASSQSLCFILSLRMNSSFTASGPGKCLLFWNDKKARREIGSVHYLEGRLYWKEMVKFSFPGSPKCKGRYLFDYPSYIGTCSWSKRPCNRIAKYHAMVIINIYYNGFKSLMVHTKL